MLLHPRAGYTHKTGGLAVNGTLTLLPTNRLKAQHKGNQVMVNEPFEGVGLMDFTRSQVSEDSTLLLFASYYFFVLPSVAAVH